METKEIEFIKDKVLDFLKDNKESDIETIIDYLDYVNKVRYDQEDILSILEDLKKADKITVNNKSYLSKS